MQGVLFDGALRVVTDWPDPSPPPGEARIRVTLAGLCSTDLAITSGYKGWHGLLGHEFTGIVDAVGDPLDAHWIGRRVVGEINVGCGGCSLCRSGLANHCPDRTALGIRGRDGAFATWCLLPIRNLHPIPDHLPDEVALFTEPLAAALEILEQLHLPPGTTAAVVGDGKLGCLVAQVLALTGADVALIGRHPERLAFPALRGIRSSDPQERFALVVECTGSASGLQTARSRLLPRGRLVLKSTHLAAPDLDFAGLMVDEISLIGSRCGPFAPALRLLASGKVSTDGLISATYPLSEAVAAFAAGAGRLKILLKPD